jgi:hypothetical protein
MLKNKTMKKIITQGSKKMRVRKALIRGIKIFNWRV